MSDTDKLEWLLRLIVTAGGPEQKPGESEKVYLMRIVKWMMHLAHLEEVIRKSTD